MKKIIFLILMLLIVISGIIIFIDMRLRPRIEEIAVQKTKAEAQIIISETISHLLKANNITDSDIIITEKDNNGKLTSLRVDNILINKLYTDIIKESNLRLSELEIKRFEIPVSLAFKSVFMFGNGPKIAFTAYPTSSVEATIENTFSSAGINQTKYQSSIHITCELVTALPLRNIQSTLKTKIVIAESVIIGEVPDYFRKISDFE